MFTKVLLAIAPIWPKPAITLSRKVSRSFKRPGPRELEQAFVVSNANEQAVAYYVLPKERERKAGSEALHMVRYARKGSQRFLKFAEDAVRCKPVSAKPIPHYRENNREFGGFCHVSPAIDVQSERIK